ncbi:MAG: NF038122 family metalloprotease, partial [Pseudonocardiaceae bacterium]
MSLYARILALAASAAFAISALAIAIPFNPLAYMLRSGLNGSGNPSTQTKPRLPHRSRVDPQDQQAVDSKPKPGEQFTIYQNENGEVTCRAATAAERKQMEAVDAQSLGLRPINHLNSVDKTEGIQPKDAPNLTIVLRGTTQLQQNPAAVAAFIKAAQNWEDIIKSPITIYIDVDYGPTRFGQSWPSGVLGATSAPSGSYPYQSVRNNLIAQAGGEGNATKQAIFNALPGTTVPTDLGDATSTGVSDPAARAIGLLPATAQSTDNAAKIAFNSSFTFDFDPSDGITAGQVDFDAVATHEIGHALGFGSEAGSNIPKPSVWDLYRFRTGITTNTFTAAQRIVTIGGSPD